MGKISSPRKRSSQSCPMVLPSSVLNRGATSDACTALAPRGHTTRYVSRPSDPSMAPPVDGVEDSIVEHRRLARSRVAASAPTLPPTQQRERRSPKHRGFAYDPRGRGSGNASNEQNRRRARHVTNRGGRGGDRGHHH